MNVTIIPIVIGAFDTVTKGLLKGLENLEVGGRVQTIQLQHGWERPEYWEVPRRLAVTQTPVKDHQLMLMWKTLKEIMIINEYILIFIMKIIPSWPRTSLLRFHRISFYIYLIARMFIYDPGFHAALLRQSSGKERKIFEKSKNYFVWSYWRLLECICVCVLVWWYMRLA